MSTLGMNEMIILLKRPCRSWDLHFTWYRVITSAMTLDYHTNRLCPQTPSLKASFTLAQAMQRYLVLFADLQAP